MKNIYRSLYFLGLIILFISCNKESGNDSSMIGISVGKGGSLARFTIVNNTLYVADQTNLKTYDLSVPGQATQVRDTLLNWNIETIYSFQDKLFIGSQTGIYIFSITEANHPHLIGQALHQRSCDPVVANDTIAFVSLRGNNRCGPATDGIYVHDIRQSITNPPLLKLFEISTPNGIGLKNEILYVCRGQNGLSLLNVSNPAHPQLLQTFTNYNFQDVIPYGNLLICQTAASIVIYDISNPANPVFLKEVVG